MDVLGGIKQRPITAVWSATYSCSCMYSVLDASLIGSSEVKIKVCRLPYLPNLFLRRYITDERHESATSTSIGGWYFTKADASIKIIIVMLK